MPFQQVDVLNFQVIQVVTGLGQADPLAAQGAKHSTDVSITENMLGFPVAIHTIATLFFLDAAGVFPLTVGGIKITRQTTAIHQTAKDHLATDPPAFPLLREPVIVEGDIVRALAVRDEGQEAIRN
ncbi:MAG: hypothetical protein C0509_08710 [Acinetobacter sp.]|nr:hypothetical protein [Acinetobacter sp.]